MGGSAKKPHWGQWKGPQPIVPRKPRVKRPLPESPYLTLVEASAYLRVDRSTLYRWIHAGKLPAFRVRNGDYRIDKAELGPMAKRGVA